jgi:hypothetical protein
MSDSTNHSDEFPGTPDPRVARSFDLAKKLIVIYGVAAALLLGTLVVIVVAGGQPTTFMWVRASILLALTPLLSRFAVRAEQGRTSSLQRLRVLTTVLPVAIIAVDLIPGLCPTWYAAMQAVSALALVPIPFLMRRAEIRATFADQSSHGRS